MRPDPPAATVAAEAPLLRFDRVERVLHWTNAVLFGLLVATGAALYAGPVSVLVGNRVLVRDLHVYAGLLLPLPVLVAIAGRHGARLRVDLGRLNRWSRDDARWLRRRNRRREAIRLGKFNPGQKLNVAFIAASVVVMPATGSIMKWNNAFPLDWRTGATFTHDWFALALGAVIIGHIALALRDRDALGAMIRGTIPAAWARRAAPLWYEELRK